MANDRDRPSFFKRATLRWWARCVSRFWSSLLRLSRRRLLSLLMESDPEQHWGIGDERPLEAWRRTLRRCTQPRPGIHDKIHQSGSGSEWGSSKSTGSAVSREEPQRVSAPCLLHDPLRPD